MNIFGSHSFFLDLIILFYFKLLLHLFIMGVGVCVGQRTIYWSWILLPYGPRVLVNPGCQA